MTRKLSPTAGPPTLRATTGTRKPPPEPARGGTRWDAAVLHAVVSGPTACPKQARVIRLTSISRKGHARCPGLNVVARRSLLQYPSRGMDKGWIEQRKDIFKPCFFTVSKYLLKSDEPTEVCLRFHTLEGKGVLEISNNIFDISSRDYVFS